jgi:hypothetical protein
MRIYPSAWRLCASAILVCASSGAQAAPEDTLKEIQAQIDALNKKGTYTVNSGSLAIESWLLTSTAIESTAAKIQSAVERHAAAAPARSVLVIAGTEPLDFGQVAMLDLEMKALTDRLAKACDCVDSATLEMTSIPALAGAVAGLLKSDTELTALSQDVDAKLLAAAVAAKLKQRAILPSAAVAAVAPDHAGTLIASFNQLVAVAERAQAERDRLASIEKPKGVEKDKLARLTAILARYDSFYTRATTPNATTGIVPLAAAARLQALMKHDPYVLKVNTEKAGGTLLKRTNVLTALGAESVFITGGLVSSYQLAEPKTGHILDAGVITCRTTLTTLKRVQNASWASSGPGGATTTAVCSP